VGEAAKKILKPAARQQSGAREGQRNQRKAGRAAHRRDVGKRPGESAVPNREGRMNAGVKMHALERHVGLENELEAATRPDYRGIVTNPDPDGDLPRPRSGAKPIYELSFVAEQACLRPRVFYPSESSKGEPHTWPVPEIPRISHAESASRRSICLATDQKE